MAGNGYAGNILFVDLTTCNVARKELDTNQAAKFIGGWGINARLAYELIKPSLDALSPEMPIILGAGLLTGTSAPSTPKSFLTTKCPSSGTVSTAVGSGYFGSRLKWAGYDHLVITGKATSPVYLRVSDDRVDIVDASSVWGKDIYDTTDELTKAYGRDSTVVCIGLAGENLVKTGIVLIDKCSTLGRTNAANFGSKNLKAILVRGSKGIAVSDMARFTRTVTKLEGAALKDPLRQQWIEQGLYFVLGAWLKAGHILHSNLTETFSEKEGLETFGFDKFRQVKKSTIGCPGCLTPDKCLVSLKTGEFAGVATPVSASFYPAVIMGMRCGAEDLHRALKLFELANRYGIDIVTFSALFDFLRQLYIEGIISKEDTGGLELKPGYETVAKLLAMTARREGLGQLLGEGWLAALRKLGKTAESYACHIKGTDPDFDARVSFGVEAFSSVTNPRGAHDLTLGGITIARGRPPEFFRKLAPRMGIPDEAMERIFAPPGFNLGRFTAHYENWATVLNCLGICFRMQSSRLYDIKTCAELYSAATGVETGPEELLKAAERAYNMCKMANVREGFSRKDDTFPERWLQPLKRPDRGEELILKDYFQTTTVGRSQLERLLDDYYREKGWDVSTGTPTREKLISLGLEHVASDMDKINVAN